MLLQIPLDPVSASRPRVSRNGFSYYEQPYKGFKDQIKKLFADRYDGPLIDYPVRVFIQCVKSPPLKSKLPFPKPDCDNFAKAVLDGMTGTVLVDDWLANPVECGKTWEVPGEPGRILIYIEPYDAAAVRREWNARCPTDLLP